MRFFIGGFCVFCCVILLTLLPVKREVVERESDVDDFLEVADASAGVAFIHDQFLEPDPPSWNRVFRMAKHDNPTVRYHLYVRLIHDFPPSPNREALLHELYGRDPGSNHASMTRYAELLSTSPTLILVGVPPKETVIARRK